MNNYEEWAQLVAKKLKGEADLITAIEKDELDDAAATEAFSRAVLEPFLPENFGIGAGRIVDAFGNYSEYLDVVVYNRDFPRIGLRGTHKAYLYESVLAAFAIRSKFIRKTFFDAMNACASLADLETNIDKTVLVRLAKKNGLTLGPNKKFVHRDPLHTARFDLIGRPPAFVFGFTGIKGSYRQLQENLELWIDNREQDGDKVEMKSLPAVIATQGCFAWRNAAPLALSNREMLGIGNDDAPIRLIVLQLLYLLNRRLNVTSDGYGLKPNLKAYLSQFSPPRFEVGAGNVSDAAATIPPQAAVDSGTSAARQATPTLATTKRADDHNQAAPVKIQEPPTAAAEPEPAPKAEPAPEPEPTPGAAAFDKPSPFASAPSPAAAEPTPRAAAEDSVFDKRSPFASAPSSADDAPMPVPEAPRAPPTTPLGSAPIPSKDDTPAKPAAAPLGSAPIPPMGKPATGAEPDKVPGQTVAANDVIPPKPPVDIQLTSDTESEADEVDDEEDEFAQTVVIPPNGGAQPEPKRNSTDDFIARVKQQLSSSDKPGENEKEKDSFSSTIPQ